MFQNNNFETLSYLIGAVVASGGAPDDGQVKHGGWLKLESEPGAAGSYTVSFLADPDETFLLDSNGIPILPLVRLPAVIRIEPCATPAECTDGLFCNGAETCQGGTCQPGPNPCTGAAPICDEPNALCTCAGAPGSPDDCNTNGIHDYCDIAAMTSQDVNMDDIPDECASAVVSGNWNQPGT